jgi:hypothetical protein
MFKMREQDAVERQGHLELWRCPHCGVEEFATVFPADEVTDIPKSEKVVARLHWQNGRITTKEAVAIRKIIPALFARPLAELIKASGESPTLELGVYNRPQAVNLVERAAQVGLKIVLEPL